MRSLIGARLPVVLLLLSLAPTMVSCVNMEPAKDTLMAVSVAVAPFPVFNRRIYEQKATELLNEVAKAGGDYKQYRSKVEPLRVAFFAREEVILALQGAIRQAAQ